MAKDQVSVCDRYREFLTAAFTRLDPKPMTLAEAREWLAGEGVKISINAISNWWSKQQRGWVLENIRTGAAQVRAVEDEFSRHPAPGLETLIKLCRVIILQFSTKPNTTPEEIGMLTDLLKPVLEFVKIEGKDKDRAIDLRKVEVLELRIKQLGEQLLINQSKFEHTLQVYQDKVAAQKAAIEGALATARAGQGLTPETLAKIEEQVRLL